MNKLTKILLASALAYVQSVSADALSAKPLRVGPVQNYGALGTNAGKVVSLSNGKQAMLRGMSLFWSDATGLQYYKSDAISWAVQNLNIDIFRFAMGIEYYDYEGKNAMSDGYSYKTSPETYISKIDQMVEAAIENDVYVIIDWHSHRAENERALAKAFFTQMAQKYANVPNIIFEIYNEPVKAPWSTIQDYANDISASIRQYTENLILVGTPFYSQMGSYGGINATNVAYVFHFYAATHTVDTFGSKLIAAMNSGNAVFISEWGTTNANGDGDPDESKSAKWISFMEANKISNCNWSFRQYTSSVDNKSEQSAMFAGSDFLTSQEALNNASYTASGTIVKNYLTSHKSAWEDSLIAGNTSGSCHMANTTVTETAGAVALKSGCTYTSSDETVATVDGSTLNILSAGFTILTANDGSKSIVTVNKEPKQTVAGLSDFRCRFGGTCSQGHSMVNYTGTSNFESMLTVSTTTTQGGKLSFETLNPEIFTVKQGTCINSKYCYSSLNSTITFVEFTATLGEGKLLVTAPAVTGYRALNDTITISFAKGQQRIHSKFKSQTLALGAASVANTLPDTTYADEKISISYTYNGAESSPYLSKVGTAIQAGTENAIVLIKASAPETDRYEAFEKSITIVIGDSALAVNKEEYDIAPIIVKAPAIPFRVQMQNNGVLLQVPQSGPVEWGVYSANGKSILNQRQNLSAGTHWISLEQVPAGSYFLKVRQGKFQNSFLWSKR